MKKLTEAWQVSDFQAGTDAVIRRGNRCFIVSNAGLYKDVEVKSDVLTDEHRANFSKLDPVQRIRMYDAIQRNPYLSDEGRNERLALFPEILSLKQESVRP